VIIDVGVSVLKTQSCLDSSNHNKVATLAIIRPVGEVTIDFRVARARQSVVRNDGDNTHVDVLAACRLMTMDG
jgi:hypothetical protein